MGFIPQVTCRHCGKKYSAIYGRCPSCGTRRVKQTSRAAVTTAGARPGTAANARSGMNAKWQFIFGCVLIVAVIAAVIVLITASLGGDKKPAPVETTPPVVTQTPQPTPTPEPTPTPTPEPTVTSITITFLGSSIPNNEFTIHMGQTIDLDATVYPVESEATVTWRSENESICTVDQDGVVTPTGAGWGKIIAECGGIAQECKVLVMN